MEAATTSQSMFTLSTAALLLGANQMGMLDTTPVRAPRRWQRRPDREGTDLFAAMLYNWPKVGVTEEDRTILRRFWAILLQKPVDFYHLLFLEMQLLLLWQGEPWVC